MPTVCTLTGKFVDGTGLARTGRVTFVPTVRGASPADDLILSLGTVVRVLDDSGSFSVDLYRTDDASWTPTGWVWTVLEDMTGATGVTYAIELTSATANLADLSPAVVTDPVTSYVSQATYDVHEAASTGVHGITGTVGVGKVLATNVAGTAPLWQDKTVYDVRDYGAVGDGTTDDSGAIQDAIDAAVLAGAGEVHAPAGNYYCATGLSIIGAPVRLVGVGASLVGNTVPSRLTFPAGVTGITVGDGGTASMMSSISRIELVSQATTAGAGDGIKIFSGRATLDSVSVRSFGGHGVNIDGTSNANLCQLEQVVVRSNYGDGIHIDGVGGNANSLRGCDSVGNQGWGFWIGSNHNSVDHGHASGNVSGGYYDDGNSNGYWLPYIETGVGSTAVFETTSLNGFWFSQNYASPVPTNNATAGGNWVIFNEGAISRQLRLTDAAAADTWLLDAGVYGSDQLRLRKTGSGLDVLRVTSTLFYMMMNARFQGTAVFDSTVTVSGKLTASNVVQFPEIDNPGGIGDTAQLYARDNGSGKTQLCVRFGSGVVQVISTEP